MPKNKGLQSADRNFFLGKQGKREVESGRGTGDTYEVKPTAQ